jgi:hypothetical protein
MSRFNIELKDFLSSMGSTQKLMNNYDDNEYKRLRTELARNQLNDAMDPELKDLTRQGKRMAIAHLGAQNANLNATSALRREQAGYYSRAGQPGQPGQQDDPINMDGVGGGAIPAQPTYSIPNQDDPATPGYAEGGTVLRTMGSPETVASSAPGNWWDRAGSIMGGALGALGGGAANGVVGGALGALGGSFGGGGGQQAGASGGSMGAGFGGALPVGTKGASGVAQNYVPPDASPPNIPPSGVTPGTPQGPQGPQSFLPPSGGTDGGMGTTSGDFSGGSSSGSFGGSSGGARNPNSLLGSQDYEEGGEVHDDGAGDGEGDGGGESDAPQGSAPDDTADGELNDGTDDATDGRGGDSPHTGGLPVSITAAHDAARDGLIMAARQAGVGRPRSALPVPGRQNPALANYLRGAGAMKQQVMHALLKHVDPKGDMPEGMRTLAVLSAGYQYYMKRGDMKTAHEFAASLTQAYRVSHNAYVGMAQAAAEHGDIDAAAKLLTKAYGFSPNGTLADFKVEGGRVTFTAKNAETGKVEKQGIIPPREFVANILGIKPDNFDQELLSMAGVRAQKEKAPSGQKPADLEKSQALVDAATPDNPDKPDKSLGDVRAIAHSLIQHNQVRADDAAKTARMLMDPTQTPEKKEAKGGAYYRFKGGPKVFVPDDTIERITDLRLAASPEGDVPPGQSRAANDPQAKETGSSIVGEDSAVGRYLGKAKKSLDRDVEEAKPILRAVAVPRIPIPEDKLHDTPERVARRKSAEEAPRNHQAIGTSGTMRRLAGKMGDEAQAREEGRSKRKAIELSNQEE